ncbi:MAG: AAA family ATPase [Patescibacteria group bacterium]|nr:AAA family ATPase [Patescibacteria group bacterium]
MYLEKLEINGFKSFASKATFIFKPGITGIVGPNGSGKSNVADAIRWVLGEQSIKLLRGKKSEDVIFSGSDKKARLGMAEVSLYFRNDQDEAELEMSEICITRKLYRNGDSEYLINKQRARLLDIQMLLARAGVAHTSYSIIGQGMIDAFLLASAAERKEFLEEASGVKTLQIKRQQSLNKLELIEENLATAKIQLNEIAPRLNSLTRQVRRLEKRVEVEQELKEKQYRYYGALWAEINRTYETERAKLGKAAEAQAKIQSEAEVLQGGMAKLTKDSANSEILEKLNNEYQNKLQEKMKLGEKIAEAKIKLAHVSVNNHKNERAIPAAMAKEVIEAIKALKVLGGKIKDAARDKDWVEMEKIANEQEQIINTLDQTLMPFRQLEKEAPKIDGEEEKIKTWQNEMKAADVAIEQIQQKIKQESEKEKQERSQIWELQQKYQKIQLELNQAGSETNNLRVEMARLETKKDDLESEVAEELGDNNWLKEKSGEPPLTEAARQEAILEITKLKHQLEMIGGIDPEIQSEYSTTKERFDFLSIQTKDLESSLESLEKLILELDETIRKQFETSFKIIDEEFQKYFKILFGGGKARLTLVKTQLTNNNQQTTDESQLTTDDQQLTTDDLQQKEESEVDRITKRLKSMVYAGVEIEATPPGKKLKSLNMLSGGERAMTSIALLCAILASNPSPFIVLDEVDAALDEANSVRYADIVERLASKSQFIIVTHNRATMEKAGLLYGVTMGDDGASTLLSLHLESAAKYTNR